MGFSDHLVVAALEDCPGNVGAAVNWIVLNQAASSESQTARTQDNRILSGIPNQGSTCYLSAAMQLFFACPPLVDYFLSDQRFRQDLETAKGNDLGSKDLLFAEKFANFLKAMKCGSVSGNDVLALLGSIPPPFNFPVNIQQDSTEFLMAVFIYVSEDINRSYTAGEQRNPKNSEIRLTQSEKWEEDVNLLSCILTDLFFGQLRNRMRCCTCNEVCSTSNSLLILCSHTTNMNDFRSSH